MLELLLHPPIPRSLLGINPRRINPLGWQTIREEALERSGSRCSVCGSTNRLEVHETYVYDYEGCIATYVTAFPLCVPCHRFVHLDITVNRWATGEVDTATVLDVADHGAALLKAAGMMPTLCQLHYLHRLAVLMRQVQ